MLAGVCSPDVTSRDTNGVLTHGAAVHKWWSLGSCDRGPWRLACRLYPSLLRVVDHGAIATIEETRIHVIATCPCVLTSRLCMGVIVTGATYMRSLGSPGKCLSPPMQERCSRSLASVDMQSGCVNDLYCYSLGGSRARIQSRKSCDPPATAPSDAPRRYRFGAEYRDNRSAHFVKQWKSAGCAKQ